MYLVCIYIIVGFIIVGFGGSVTVVELQMQLLPIQIYINSVSLTLDGSTITCMDTSSLYSSYTYSPDDTPVVESITPQTLSPKDEMTVSLKGISNEAEDNILTIGGLACQVLANNTASTLKTQPNFATPISGTAYFATSSDTCTIPNMSAGN